MSSVQKELAEQRPETETSVAAAHAATDTAPAMPPALPDSPKHIALPADMARQLATIDEISAECSLALAGATSKISHALMLARGMNQLRALFTPIIMKDVISLRGTALGFTTDRDKSTNKPAYNEEEVKEAAIEAMLRGAYLTGNEFTIIVKRPHLTKEHWKRRVKELPGVSDLEVTPGVPSIKADAGGSALVPMVATWNYRGRAYRLNRVATKAADGTIDDKRIPCKINDGQGADQVIGKAERKIYKQIFERLTGSVIIDDALDDDDAEQVIDVEARPADERAEAASAQSADDKQEPPGGFDWEDFFLEYGAKLQAAVESGEIVQAGRARAAVTGPESDLPPTVREQVNAMHDIAVKEIREKKKGK